MSTLASLYQLQNEIERLYRPLTRTYHLPPMALLLLSEIYAQPGLGASDYAAMLGRPPTSFTPIIDSVVNEGYVVRGANLHDRRAIVLTPSLTAHAARENFCAEMQAVEAGAASLMREWTMEPLP